MKQVVKISLGQKKLMGNPKTKWNENTFFNPRTVRMIGDDEDTHFVSIEERETGIEDFKFLKSRELIDYNPIEEEF